MTHIVQTSEITYGIRPRRVAQSTNLYQAIINGEEGEYYEYEIEANSFAEASAIAEMYAADIMVDIRYIEVYQTA